MQIWFMPWAGLTSELQMGSITFWPYETAAKTKISDKSVRDHLDRYFACYVDHKGRPVETIAVCSHGIADFRQFTDTESLETRSAVDALIFSIISSGMKNAVCIDNRTMGPPSADRYQLLVQNFQPGSDDISVHAGSLRSGGWKLGEISFSKPWHMGGSSDRPDQELVQGFDKTFKKRFPSNLRSRLLRSLEWFRYAHTESDEIPTIAKVVMMATAFEIILAVPNVQNKSDRMAKELENKCASCRSLRQTRKDRKRKKVNRSKLGWWAWDFYKLRNAIVHGDSIKPKMLQYRSAVRDWLSQLIVADLVFWECVTRELYSQKCLGTNARACSGHLDKLFPNEPAGSAEGAMVNWFLGYENVHQSVGWLPKLKLKRNKP
jgi:hypothetical protein